MAAVIVSTVPEEPRIRPIAIIVSLAVAFAATWFFGFLDVRDNYIAPVELAVFAGFSFVAVMVAHRLSPRAAGVRMGLASGVGHGMQLVAIAAIPVILVAALSPMVVAQIVGDAYPRYLRPPRVTWMRLFTEGIAGPLAEEILFRGFLLTELRRSGGLSIASAVVLSSLAFGLAHVAGGGGLFLLLGTALGGAVFGWLRERLGTLWPAIGLHALINLAWLVTLTAYDDGFALGVAQMISLAIAVFLSLGWAAKRSTAD